MNLLQETLKILEENNKFYDDIVWIGNDKYEISKEKFKELADSYYYSSYGGEEVAMDLLVVGKDWWLERHSYDGAEWWEFKTLPTRSKNPKEITVLTTRQASEWCYPELEELNSEGQDF